MNSKTEEDFFSIIRKEILSQGFEEKEPEKGNPFHAWKSLGSNTFLCMRYTTSTREQGRTYGIVNYRVYDAIEADYYNLSGEEITENIGYEFGEHGIFMYGSHISTGWAFTDTSQAIDAIHQTLVPFLDSISSLETLMLHIEKGDSIKKTGNPADAVNERIGTINRSKKAKLLHPLDGIEWERHWAPAYDKMVANLAYVLGHEERCLKHSRAYYEYISKISDYAAAPYLAIVQKNNA